MEKVGKRTKVDLVSDPSKLKKLLAKPQLQQNIIINEILVVVDRDRKDVMQNRSTFVGFTALHVSKFLFPIFTTVPWLKDKVRMRVCYSAIHIRYATSFLRTICIVICYFDILFILFKNR
jgi:hypothetical protein